MNAVASVIESPTTVASVDTRVLVKQAADELLIAGERPTVANVRARIGRGSATTINSALSEWWRDLAARLANARTRPDVPAPVIEAADRLWSVAMEQAHETLKEHREAASKEVAEAKDAAAAALLAQTQAEQQMHGLETRYQALEETRLDLERRLVAETEHRRAAESKIAEVRADGERRFNELSERMRELEQSLVRERERFDSMEKRLSHQLHDEKTARRDSEAKHREEAGVWRTEKNELIGQLRDAHSRHAEAQGRITSLQAQLDEIQRAMHELRTEKEALITDRATREATLVQSQRVENALQRELHTLRETVRILEANRATLQQHLEETRRALTEAQTESARTD